jgi:hypothetical protein
MEPKYVVENREVRRKLKEITEKTKSGCVPVNLIAKELKKDPRTVRSHMQLIEDYGEGAFLDPGKKIFCPREGIENVCSKLRGSVSKSTR